jgi:predicted DsbA family dithiol-disulfide isomerase
MEERRLPITVFADFTCPYSYLSEAILWEVPASRAELRFRAHELYPGPDPPPRSDWSSVEWATITRLAEDAGVELRPPRQRPLTRKAHEAARFAREHGAEIALRQVIYSLYWGDGADIARIDLLAGAADSIGLDGQSLRIALDIDQFAAGVDADAVLADRLRIPGVPAIFLGTGPTARIVLGAQPAGELRRLVDAAIGNHPGNE